MKRKKKLNRHHRWEKEGKKNREQTRAIDIPFYSFVLFSAFASRSRSFSFEHHPGKMTSNLDWSITKILNSASARVCVFVCLFLSFSLPFLSLSLPSRDRQENDVAIRCFRFIQIHKKQKKLTKKSIEFVIELENITHTGELKTIKIFIKKFIICISCRLFHLIQLPK